MIQKLMAQLVESVTYKDFVKLWQIKQNVDSFDQPTGLTFTDNSFLRYVSFAALYFAQGIPAGLLHFALPAWMAMNDYTAMDIGKYLAIVTLPWSFKIIAAPIMDRFTYLAMGRRRPWLIFGQLGIVMGMIFMSTIQNPQNNLIMLMSVGFVINLFTIFQDIATDGLAIDVLPEHQQARANGLMWGSKTLGISGTVAITIWLFNKFGFSTTLLVFSVFVSVIMMFPLIIKERPVEKRLPWTKGKVSEDIYNLHLPSWKLIVQRLIKAFFLPISLIMGLAAFSQSITSGIIDAGLPVFTVNELGWSDDQYTQVLSSSKLIAGILGMLIGGAMIDKIGKIKMMSGYLIAMITLFITFFFLSSYWQNQNLITSFFLIYYTLDTLIVIAIFASAMQLCSKQVAATQFTLYMTISNLGMSSGSYLMGHLEQLMEWRYLFLINIVFMLVSLFLFRFIDFEKHKKRMNLRMNPN